MTWSILFVAGGISLAAGGLPAFAGLLVGLGVDMWINEE